MSIKLLKRLSCCIISGVCCCLFCLLLATAANADVCFLPTGQCEAASANLSTGCSGFNLTSAKDETGWNCTQCGEKWKCEKKSCKDDYKTDVRCSGTETKVCDETRKSGDESCCKCEDSATKCQHEGYVYKKTSTNENCTGKCPYNSDYYESCECNAKYDKSSNTNACYTYNTCELGDLAGTKKYEQASDVHKCKDYIDNSAYVTDNSEQVKSGDYDCTLVCTETCDNSNRKYYQCSPKKDDDPCENGPYSWRDTECCAKDEWKDTVYCKKPTCTITAGGKSFGVVPFFGLDYIPKVCDDRLKAGLGISNLQYACNARGPNNVLGMIRYCGGINDFAGIDDMNVLASAMYGTTITNNSVSGIYNQCEIPATGLPKYDNLTVSNTDIYNQIKTWKGGYYFRECFNGDEAGFVSVSQTSYGVNYAPVLTSNGSGSGVCVCRDEEGCTPKACPTGTLRETDWQYMIDHGINSYNCWEEAEVDDGCGGKMKCFSNKCSDGTCYKSYSDIPTEYQNGNYTTLIHGYCVRNSKVTVYYDAPTNCNYSFNFTNKSTNAVTQVGAATQTIVPGTYTVRPSTMGVQSFTIKMGRGGTPICYNTSGTDYTFSIGNEYWIVPNCSSTCSGSSGGGSSGGSSGSNMKVCYCYGSCCGTSTANCIAKCGGAAIASQCIRKDVSPNQYCY